MPDIKKLLESLLPALALAAKAEKDKPMEHRMERPKGKPDAAEMSDDAEELAKQKVIVMLLDGKEEDDEDEEYC